MEKLSIVYLPVDSLTPYENNTRKHSEHDIEGIKESIRQTGGFNDPIGIWGGANLIVEGHGRLIAARELGMTEVPCIRLDHMTEEERRKYAILHNKTAELSEWDKEILKFELGELDFGDFDFGFSLDESEAEKHKTTEDQVPDLDEGEETVTNLGDVWELGRHRLICGDSTDKVVFNKLLGENNVDMVFTDPPYGYNFQSNLRTKSEKFDVILNDDKILDFFPNLIGRVNGFVMICTTWKVLDEWLPLLKKYFELSNVIIWDKGGGGIGDLEHTFATDYEMILCANNGAKIKGKRIGSVWSIGKDNANDYIHPMQKPVELAATAILHTTDKNQSVLDCFGGSGSTLMACEQLERTCYTCELDPHYCDAIVQRYINYVNSDKDVYLNRNGERLKYSEIENDAKRNLYSENR